MTALDVHLDHFAYRLMRDAMNEGTALYWRHRAKTFEWARPRPGDFVGLATPEDLAARDAALVELIDACHAKAAASVLGAVA